MKIRTLITLSEDLLKAIDSFAEQYKNRSEFIETASWIFITQKLREKKNARDFEIINKCADRLNQEAMDVLAYQVSL